MPDELRIHLSDDNNLLSLEDLKLIYKFLECQHLPYDNLALKAAVDKLDRLVNSGGANESRN